jgi:WD40 repeat protein
VARLWQVAGGKAAGPPLPHQALIAALAFSPDGKVLLTGSSDRTARLWDVSTGLPLGPRRWHDRSVSRVAFHPKGRTFLTGSADHTARLWTMPTPLPGDAERAARWIEATAGVELDEHAALRWLDDRTRSERRQRLEELGGAPLAGNDFRAP